MSATRILGLDLGTSGCKAIVFDRSWNIVARSSRRYDLIRVGDSGYELDAESVWAMAREAIAEAHARAGAKTDALAISALGDVIIPLGATGTPVRPCILDFDPRGKDEIRDFVAGFGTEKLFETTGMPPLHINSLAKILWFRKNEPETFRQVRRWATFEDYHPPEAGRHGCRKLLHGSEDHALRPASQELVTRDPGRGGRARGRAAAPRALGRGRRSPRRRDSWRAWFLCRGGGVQRRTRHGLRGDRRGDRRG